MKHFKPIVGTLASLCVFALVFILGNVQENNFPMPWATIIGLICTITLAIIIEYLEVNS